MVETTIAFDSVPWFYVVLTSAEQLILGTFMGFFMFTKPPVYGWFLSATAIPLNTSWSLHNVIAWMKVKPFLSKKWSWLYIGTVILAQPYWVVEIYANFTFFNNINDWFVTTETVRGHLPVRMHFYQSRSSWWRARSRHFNLLEQADIQS